MSASGTQRRLAAILAADVVGYSKLMGEDEAGTLAALKAIRTELIEPKIAEHSGRVFKTTGDGLLAEFPSVVNAVGCAVAIQKEMTERGSIQLRIGINVGDVIVEEGDVFGDAVNVASRIEGIAPPGGIALTETAREHLGGKFKLELKDTGTHSLKNIERPIRGFVSGGLDKNARADTRMTDKPSIAVLPFVNMSSDAEQEYFADGLTEDLITDLSKVHEFTVIARNSCFAYKGKSIDARVIARELGVRYVIEGSVRRSATRVRINAQLIDAAEHRHIWADRFDRELVDVFELQDEIVKKIVISLSGALPPTRRKAANLEAYDLFIRARALVIQTPESNKTARQLLQGAIELDPAFPEAHAWLARSYEFGWKYGGEAREPNHSLALAAAQRALKLDPENVDAHMIMGNLLMYEGTLDKAEAELNTTLQLDPNNANAWAWLGELKVSLGLASDAVEAALAAFRLNPHAPGWYYWLLGYTLYAAHRYEEAIRALRHPTTYLTGSTRLLAASLAQLGCLEEAKEEGRRFLAINPHFSVGEWANIVPFRCEADRQHFVEGYLKAGLPE